MPTKPPMIFSSQLTEFLKWVVVVLLAAMLVGVTGMAYWVPVQGYIVTCEQSGLISCEIERRLYTNKQSWQVALGTKANATVKIQPMRRGLSRVFLYLSSSSQSVFAAEFEGGGGVAQANAAAAKLNRIFSSDVPMSASVEARPPAYFKWLIWGGISFFGILVLTIYRELLHPRFRPNNSPK